MLRKKILLVGNPSLRRIKFLKFNILGDHQNKMSAAEVTRGKTGCCPIPAEVQGYM